MRSAGDRLWIGIEGPTIDASEWAHLESVRPGGIVLFRRNIESRDQVRALTNQLRERLGPLLHVVVDQEGGAVVRFEDGCTVFPGNLSLGALAAGDREKGLRLAREWGRVSGMELRAMGIDGNLAPVCDLTVRADNPGVGCRSFGGDPALVGSLAAALVSGHRDAGVFAVLKHFPGLGAAALDSHDALPRVPAPDVVRHLEPFALAIAAGARVVMTAHLIHEGLDAELPATLSPLVVGGVLRERIGFGGVVMTDALEMGAVTDLSIEERVEGAVRAGHDVLCLCEGRELQARARACLDAMAAGDDERVSARLDSIALAPPPPASPNVPPGEDVAAAIAVGCVTTLRQGRAPTTIPADERWLLILPTQRNLSPAEDPLRAEDLRPFASALGDRVTLLEVGAEPSREEIARAATASAEHDGIIVATIGLRSSEARRQLLLSALEWHPRTLVVLLGDPGELASLPARDFTAVTAYGYRRPHQAALVKLLRGEITAKGRWPVSPEVRLAAHLD